MSPGAWLRARREQLGLSQVQVADRAGTAQGTISQFERDNFPADVRVSLERLSVALGAPPTALREQLVASSLLQRNAA